MKRNRSAKRTVLDVTIDSLGHLGDGKARHDTRDLLVPGALPGERWRVGFEGKRGRIAIARPLQILQASDARQEPVCPHFGRCGGCALQHLPTEDYDALKRKRITEALRHQKVDCPTSAQTLKSPLASRRRLRLAFDGKKRLGLREAGSKSIVDLSECAIADARIVSALQSLRAFVSKLDAAGEISITALDDGLDALLITPATPSLNLIDAAANLPLLRLSWSEKAYGFSQTLHQQKQPMIRLAGRDVGFPAGAFLQATKQGEKALQDFAVQALQGHSTVADFFCGLGTLSLALAAQGHKVSGFDNHEASLRLLKATGELRSCETLDLMTKPPSPARIGKFDAVLLDPPRAGAEALCQNIATSGQNHVVYASCNPASFARDAAILSQSGFKLTALQPVDQFLYSSEIELIASFERN